MPVDFLASEVQVSSHRAGDDLLSAGLGLDGLRLPAAPFANPLQPTVSELRRRAIHASWAGIADLSAHGGYGTVYGAVPLVPGREYHAFARLRDAGQPFRVLLQAPDDFDRAARCLVVTASSGSRGVYGAQALAGAFALPRGCAVVHTDKATGAGYYDSADQSGVGLDGRRQKSGTGLLEFEPRSPPATGIGVKHAHSQDNPEAAWGHHVLHAARFGLAMMDRAYPEHAPFTADNTHIIATGLSNGGGAVLQAAGMDSSGLLDAVVAIEPNVHVPGGRPLYDYATEAAIWLPCALLEPRLADAPMAAPLHAAGLLRCATLQQHGLVSAGLPMQQASEALEHLLGHGWTLPVLRVAAASTALDLWRAVAAGYASAYLRADVETMPCGFSYRSGGAAPGTEAVLRAGWWADGSGIPPGNGIVLADAGIGAMPDPLWPGLQCLRALWQGDDVTAQQLRQGVAELTAQLPREGLPVWLVHGARDGLIPPQFTSDAYMAWLARHGRSAHYWKIEHGQHFDAFLGLPRLGDGLVPLLPYAYTALDQVYRHVVHGAPLQPGATPRSQPRGAGPLQREALGLGH